MIDLFKRQSTNQALIAGGSICVWGPTGSPGKSTLALNLACELASSGKQVLLIDLDTYSASIGTLIGVAEPGPGVAAAARLARSDELRPGKVCFERIRSKGGKLFAIAAAE